MTATDPATRWAQVPAGDRTSLQLVLLSSRVPVAPKVRHAAQAALGALQPHMSSSIRWSLTHTWRRLADEERRPLLDWLLLKDDPPRGQVAAEVLAAEARQPCPIRRWQEARGRDQVLIPLLQRATPAARAARDALLAVLPTRLPGTAYRARAWRDTPGAAAHEVFEWLDRESERSAELRGIAAAALAELTCVSAAELERLELSTR